MDINVPRRRTRRKRGRESAAHLFTNNKAKTAKDRCTRFANLCENIEGERSRNSICFE